MRILGNNDTKKRLEVAIKANVSTLIIGETGCGKTTIVRDLAETSNADVIRFNMTGETSVDEFVGKYTLAQGETVWQDGILLQAVKQGKWLVVDEINVALPEILFVLHSLLDDDRSLTVANHDGELVKPHKSFRFFATMNPVEEYAGTKDLNKAFLSRFGMVLTMTYPDAKTEAKVVKRAGIDDQTADKLVDVGVTIRKAKAEGKVYYTCSTRDVIQWAALIPELGMQHAFEVTILGKAAADAPAVREIYQQVIGQWDEAEAKSDGKPIYQHIKEQLDLIEHKRAEIKAEILAEIAQQLEASSVTA